MLRVNMLRVAISLHLTDHQRFTDRIQWCYPAYRCSFGRRVSLICWAESWGCWANLELADLAYLYSLCFYDYIERFWYRPVCCLYLYISGCLYICPFIEYT